MCCCPPATISLLMFYKSLFFFILHHITFESGGSVSQGSEAVCWIRTNTINIKLKMEPIMHGFLIWCVNQKIPSKLIKNVDADQEETPGIRYSVQVITEKHTWPLFADCEDPVSHVLLSCRNLNCILKVSH